MKRVLVADDDASIRLVVQETLEAEQFEVVVAELPSLAIEIARRESVDLVISDVNMPEMNGFWMCEEIRKLPGREALPFLFMSGADEKAELDIAHSLGNERLLLKPFSLDGLLRAVGAVLGEARTEKGEVARVLEPILSRVASDRETGVLVTVDGGICKRFVFRDGALVFASSNDRQDLIGQALMRAGVISERDLLDAFAAGASGAAEDPAKGPRLGLALASMRKLTPEQCQKAFVTKVRESLLDVFLWERGSAEFMAGPVEGAENPMPLTIELDPLRIEGSRRRARWATVKGLLPPPDHQIERAGSWPAGFPKDAGDQLLARHIDRGLSLAELFLELRGNRFAVGVKVARLLKDGVVRTVEPVGFTGSASQEPSPEDLERARLELELSEKLQSTEGDTNPRRSVPPDTAGTPVHPGGGPAHPGPAAPLEAPSRPTEEAPRLGAAVPAGPSIEGPRKPGNAAFKAFSIGLIRFRAGDLEGARETFSDVLDSDPLNELARRRLEEVENVLAEQWRQRGLRHDRRIRLTAPISSLVGRKFPTSDSFLLSRLVRNPYTIGDLVVLAPFPECDTLASVERLLDEKIVADEREPIRLRAEYRTAAEAVHELTRAVSKGELNVETKKPLPVGSRFVIEILSPELDRPLELSAVVTFVMEHGPDAEGGSPHGMTVKYLFDSEESRANIEATVDEILRCAEPEKRRRWPRIPTAFKVVETGDPYRTTYTIRNLSEGGMLLVPDSPDLAGGTVLVGTRVKLSIVATGQTHEIPGVVVWSTERSRANTGGAIGVRFDSSAESILTDLMKMKLLPQSLSIEFG